MPINQSVIAHSAMHKPTVHILHRAEVRSDVLELLRQGMEEEGVPWEEDNRTAGDATALAWEAAQASRLGVGLGVDGENIALHFFQLDPQAPLYKIPCRSVDDQVRALGANAARIPKKLPLKPIDRR